MIAIGITTDLPKTGPKIVDSVNEITRIFTSDLGYERATSLDIDPGREQITQEVRKFCLGCDEDDVVVLYYTSHADEVGERHRVWAGDTRDSVSDTLETAHLASLMLAGTPLRNVLIILDTCFAGKGGAEALRTSMPSAGEGDKTLALLTAAYPREQIVAGSFARLFARAVERPAVAGHEPRYLTLGAIARLIEADPSRPQWQTVSYSVLFGKTDNLPFFPNRRYNRDLHGLDLLTQLRIEQQEMRAADMAGHFLPRARGVDIPAEPGWRFVGRAVALRDLARWLRDRDDSTYRVVTGGPGSGKSALIGRLVVLSDHYRRPTVPLGDDVAADTVPPEDSISVGIHARGLTTAQVLAAVCAAVGVSAGTPADLLREMRQRQVTVAIDAIDEALDPVDLVSRILRPLIEGGPAKGLRLLLGTRPHLLAPLGAKEHVLDLDDDRYADPESLREYVFRGLETSDPQSPYHSVPADVVAAITTAVAEAASHSFLVARIVSRTLLSSTHVPDPYDSGWRAKLPATASDAMHADLESRLGAKATRARDLLRPLAFAHGAGLPWEDIWAALAATLSGHDYTDDDLIWLRSQAGSYVVETMESEHSVYRLYHAALAEYLRQGCDERAIHDQFSAFLVGRVPTSGTDPDWSRAHPYTLTHLATHAQESGTLDELLLDPGYLIHAAPAGLLAALSAARSPDTRLAAEAYQRAVHQLRDRPEDYRFSYLELASRIMRAAVLAKRIDERAPRRRWSVPWAHWPPEHPHRVLGGQLGPVNAVACTVLANGKAVAASAGQDARLRIWDLVTAEPEGSHKVRTAPLIAIRFVRLPGDRTVIVLLGADGKLHIWDMLTASITEAFSTVPRWRRMLGLGVANPSLRPLGTGGYARYLVVSGRGMPTSLWDLSENRRIALLPSHVAPDTVSLADLVDGQTVLIARTGGSESWVADLATGRQLPCERRRLQSTGLGSLVDDVIRQTHLRYLALPASDGRPVVAARFYRRSREVVLWDLTVPNPLGTWPADGPPARIRLTNGLAVRVPVRMDRRATSGNRPPTVTEQPDDNGGLGGTEPGPPPMLVPLSPRVPSPLGEDASRMSAEMTFESSERSVHVVFRDLAQRPPTTVRLTLSGHTADVTAYDWTRLPDGHPIVITGSRDGTVRRWDISSLSPSRDDRDEPTQPSLHQVYAVPAHDGTVLGLTVGSGGEVSLWNLGTGRLLSTFSEQQPPCAICSVPSDQERHLALIFAADATARLWALSEARLVTSFRTDPVRWPARAAAQRLPDGNSVAVTTGHGRKTLVWDVTAGQVRDVLSGHRGWSSCVVCAHDARGRPLALTGGTDNRVNVWDLRSGRRLNRFRIVSRPVFLISPPKGRVTSVRQIPLRGSRHAVFVATADGRVHALHPRPLGMGARRVATIPGTAIATGTLSNGQPVAIIARPDGVVQVWAADDMARAKEPLCEIDLEISVRDISEIHDDMFVIATPNGLAAIRLHPGIAGLAHARSRLLLCTLDWRHERPERAMFNVLPRSIPADVGRYLLPWEQAVIVIRHHPAELVGPIGITITGLLGAGLLSEVKLSPDVTLGVWAVWLVLLLYMLIRVLGWFSNHFVVTPSRMVAVKGILARDVEMLPITAATTLRMRRTAMGRLLGYGKFILAGVDQDPIVRTIDFVPYPEQLYLEVCGLIFPDPEA